MPAKLFRPILPGATLRGRLIGCVGILVSLMLTALLSDLVADSHGGLPLLVAPMGAAAALLFILPTSPFSQPWVVIFGNTISATVGLVVAGLIDNTMVAGSLAVVLAIIAMSFTRSLHPPGASMALGAVLGTPLTERWHWLFPLVPVALNASVLVLFALAFHRLTGEVYPHPRSTPDTDAPETTTDTAVVISEADIDAAIAAHHETLDIDRRDLVAIIRAAQREAVARSAG
ncbi:HPP family protein [Nocardioides sp. Kera G14]|uniref:HPP family protein n=1 Tax=Nocardioides sp. Kera G14 TaxID=2884264 RepID=UPI001D121C50|nr:HPP family protein [Nocardioides sp. Kera G14]UDY23384.1 HPP family protein [Nocardioides sp. Kera G14]